MKNNLLKYYKDFLIDKEEYEAVLKTFAQYFKANLDTATAITMFCETTEPSSGIREIMNNMLKTINTYGDKNFEELLLENKILLNRNEATLYKSFDDKSIAVNKILESRTTKKSLTSEIHTIYILHLYSAFTMMSLYLFDAQLGDSLVMIAKMTDDTKQGIHIPSQYWKVFEIFIISIPYFVWGLYMLFFAYIGKFFSMKLYYKVNKYKEVLDLLQTLELISNQLLTGANFYISIENILDSVDKNIKLALMLVLKEESKGKREMAKQFEKAGFSKQTFTPLKLIDTALEDEIAVTQAITTLEGRRENLKIIISQRNHRAAILMTVLTQMAFAVVLGIEMFYAYIGINIK